jgi:malonate transporter MadL subunit
MVIYGVALLALCLLAGLFTGELLGQLIGVEANVGGVGIAMLLLILVGDWLRSWPGPWRWWWGCSWCR